jgi:hypothetical protein
MGLKRICLGFCRLTLKRLNIFFWENINKLERLRKYCRKYGSQSSSELRRSFMQLSYMATLTYLVEVEGEVPCHRAVESRLQEGRPPVSEAMWSSAVMFADTSHAGINSLQTHSSCHSSSKLLCARKNYTSLVIVVTLLWKESRFKQ